MLVAPLRAAPVAALQVWFNVGSADERPPEAGIAHVLEHMLFKGTARRGVGEIPREIEGAGGDINAWTSHDHTCFHVVVPSRELDVGLDVLADTVQNAALDPAELVPELKVIREEIRQREDSPSRMASQALFSRAFSGHPYGRPVIGYDRVVRGLQRPAILRFLRRWYVPENALVVVVGDFEPAEALALVRRRFGRWRGSRAERHEPPLSQPRALRVQALRERVSESQLVLGWHIPRIEHPDGAALDLLAIALGQGESSRLHLGVLRHKQLVSEVYAYSASMRQGGLLVTGAALPGDDPAPALGAMLDEVRRAADEGIRADELDKARAVLESETVYHKETAQGFANKLAMFETLTSGLDFESEYLRRVAAVAPAALSEVARRYLDIQRLTLAALVPAGRPGKPGRDAALEKRLAAVARAHAAPPRRARTTAPDPLSVHRLASGGQLVVLRDPSVPLVAMRAAWLGGSRLEDARTAGINHFLSTVITKGTRQRSAESLAREVEGMAGALDGSSGRNSFGLRGELLSRHLDRGLPLLIECALEPAFDPVEVDKERKLILDDLASRDDDLTGVTFRVFGEALWQRHPYRLDPLGTPESIRAMTPRRLAAYHQRHFGKGAMTLAVVGDVDPERLLPRVEALLGGAGGASIPRPVVARDPPGPARRVARELDKQQAHLVVGFPGTTLDDPDRFAIEVLTTLLSGQSGRLFLDVRDRRGLAYRVSAFSMEGLDPGYVAVYLSTTPQNLAEAEAAVWSHLERLRTERVEPDELLRTKRYLVGSHDISLQRKSALAASIAFGACYGLGADEHRRYGAAVEAVSSERLLAVARRIFDPARAVVAVVGPRLGRKTGSREAALPRAARV